MIEACKTFDQYMDSTNSKPMPLFDQDTWPYFMRIYWPRRSDDSTTKEIQPTLQRTAEDGLEIAEKLNRLDLKAQNPEPGHA